MTWAPQWFRLHRWDDGKIVQLEVIEGDTRNRTLRLLTESGDMITLPWLGCRAEGWFSDNGRTVHWQSGPPQKMT